MSSDVEEECFVYPAITKRYSEVTDLGPPEQNIDNGASFNHPDICNAESSIRPLRSTLKAHSQFDGVLNSSKNDYDGGDKGILKQKNQPTKSHIKGALKSSQSNWSNSDPTTDTSLLSIDRACMNRKTSIQHLRKYSVVDPNALRYFDDSEKRSREFDVCSALLIFISYLIIIMTFPLSLFVCIKVLTKDSVTVAVDAVVYYRIYNPVVAITNVEDADRSTRLLAATTLRNVLGTRNLAEILSERESISTSMQAMLDDATDPWGVKVERVEVKDVRLPVQLQRAMAAEAEATREARAKVIAAEGEEKSSLALKLAADVIQSSPFALQLRYLQTLSAISAEKNSTIIFPLPIDILANLVGR